MKGPVVKRLAIILCATCTFFIVITVSIYFKPTSKIKPWYPLEPILLQKIESKYGVAAKQRFLDWNKLIAEGKTLQENDKLQQVNDFFNRNIRFIDDNIAWSDNDYWATPIELLAQGVGDCEDFSIAKYFTLLEVGVDKSKLRITYVKASDLNVSHMVLTYFESPNTVPLVLDNLNPNIKSATDRSDLFFVYSFNGDGLWLAKINGNGRQLANADRLDMWADLNRRMLELPL